MTESGKISWTGLETTIQAKQKSELNPLGERNLFRMIMGEVKRPARRQWLRAGKRRGMETMGV